MADCNIRNVPEEVMRGAKLAAAREGVTLREWVIGAMTGELGQVGMKRGQDSSKVAVHLSEVANYTDEGIRKALEERGEVSDEIVMEASREEVRDSLRGMIRHMEENGPQNAPAVDPGPPNKRVVCKYWEYDEEEGEHYRCGSDEGHRGKHTRGEKMVGEGRRKGCAEHGDKWCMECG